VYEDGLSKSLLFDGWAPCCRDGSTAFRFILSIMRAASAALFLAASYTARGLTYNLDNIDAEFAAPVVDCNASPALFSSFLSS